MSSTQLPSLLVCGSQIGHLDTAYLNRLWSVLAHDPELVALRREVTELPELWSFLLAKDSSLEPLAAAPLLKSLAEWATTGDSTILAVPTSTTRNIQLAVLTVLAHVLEYTTYLNHCHGSPEVITENASSTKDVHANLLDSVREAGIQGLCIGLLSATSLACSHNKANLAKNAGVAMRLALCVGAYVDLDDMKSLEPFVSVAARWLRGEDDEGEKPLEAVLDSFPEAYMSVRMDVASGTITAPRSVSIALTNHMQDTKGFVAREFDLRGRFHHAAHQPALEKLISFCASLPMLQFPPGSSLLVPVRRNDNGGVAITTTTSTDDGTPPPLHEMLLRCILVERADWKSTITKSAAAMAPDSRPGSQNWVLLLGPVQCIPHSLQLQVIRPFVGKTSNASDQSLYTYPHNAIAIIGASGRFPGSETLDDFWDIIQSKTSTMGPPHARRGYPQSQKGGQEPFRGNYIGSEDMFDHAFFRKSSREAAYMDPQHRIALHLAYETLESAGYFSPSNTPPEDVGCYIGMSSSDYLDNVNAQAPTAFSFTGSARSFAPGRISNFFGWTGPSLAIDTACASSATAIHTAVRAVQSGECSMALTGGVNLIASPRSHELLGAASFLSQTGQCRPFDEGANGYSRGEAAGFVLLKKLSSAVADNDRILGVISGSAVNNSKGNASITVPSSDSQSDLYRRVLTKAEMYPSQVTYVEAHGTGTQKGDPVEAESIRRVFGGQTRRLRFGSVKGNIGHGEAAAGVTSLMKVLMMLQHVQIPPEASFWKLNPKLGPIEEANMEIPSRLQPWRDGFRVACVNNYGASGTNVAMIACQAPPRAFTSFHVSSTSGLNRCYPFLVAAHSGSSLRRYCRKLVQFIENRAKHWEDDATLLSSVAFHLAQRQNHALAHRKIFSAKSISELKACLEDMESTNEKPRVHANTTNKPVVLVFAGQTGYRTRLSEAAYNGSLLLRQHLDRCDRTLQGLGRRSLFPHIFGTKPITDLADMHCMHFSLQYAAAMSWIDAGLVVSKVVGHSLGQLTALCVAGAVSLHDGLKLVSGRAELIREKWGPERGSMLIVDADVGKLKVLMTPLSTPPATPGVDTDASKKDLHLEIACYNSASSHIVVGSEAAISTLEHTARSSGISSKRLAVSHGFHSQLVDPIIDDFSNLVRDLTLRNPLIPIEACAKFPGSWADITPEVVVRQTRDPVYFSDAIVSIEKQHGPSCTWIEAGSGPVGVTMVSRALDAANRPTNQHTFHSIPLHQPDAIDKLTAKTVALWREGVQVQNWLFHSSERSRYVDLKLPAYQFDLSRSWLQPSPSPNSVVPQIKSVTDPDFPDEKLLLHESRAQPKAPLVSFERYHSKGSRDLESPPTVEFTINQHSDEYNELVNGRTVLGNILSPGSVWFESACRALSLLQRRAVSAEVSQVKLVTAFGLDLNKRLALTLRKQSTASAQWHFAVMSHSVDEEEEGAKLQASGLITCRTVQEGGSAAQLGPHGRMLHRSVDHDRWQSLRHDTAASIVQGAFVRKVLGRLADYSAEYFGIQFLATKGWEAVAEVVMPSILTSGISTLPKAGFSPTLFDNFLLVAEMHANNLDDCQADQVHICNGIDAVIPYGLREGPWTIYSRLSKGTTGDKRKDTAVVSDIFAFNPNDNALEFVILGACFSRVRRSVLQDVVDGLNGARTVRPSVSSTASQPQIYLGLPKVVSDRSDIDSGFVSSAASTAATPDIEPVSFPWSTQGQAEQAPAGSASTDDEIDRSLMYIQSIAKGLLEEIIAGVPLEDINEATCLSDVGVDSLSVTELQARIREVFHVDLQLSQYLEENILFGKLCQEIHSRVGGTGGQSRQAKLSSSDGLNERATDPPAPGPSAPSPDISAEHDQDKNIVRLSTLLAEYLDCEAGAPLDPDVPLGDMGLDSLVSIELMADVREMLGKSQKTEGLAIDPAMTFAELCDKLFPRSSKLAPSDIKSSTADASELTSSKDVALNLEISDLTRETSALITQALPELRRVTENYTSLAQETGMAGFYSGIHQKQLDLVHAYLAEAFRVLGCDLVNLKDGDAVPVISYKPKYQKLVALYFRFLVDADIIAESSDPSGFRRTAKLFEPRPAEELHRSILAEFPGYSPDHSLLRVTAAHLADCLSGQADPLVLLFHEKSSRELLSDVYKSSPMFATGNKILNDLLRRLLTHHNGGETLRVLEIGAGTGGTTHGVLAELLASGVDFTYTFTDVSAALVSSSRKLFQAQYGAAVVNGKMEWAVLNIEGAPPPAMLRRHHLVLSANCIHATKDLNQSCGNIQKLLRPDGGMLCLLELTRPQAWLDCVFGLLDGWWQFDDGRDYALLHEEKWKDILLGAGFRQVEWSGGDSRESEQIKVITSLNVEA